MNGNEVLVMGAGAVGCFVGGSLAASGVPVTFIGRPKLLAELAQHGLSLSDLEGRRSHLPAGQLRLAHQVPADARPALVLLTVKSAATAEAAAQLAAVLPAGTTVLSLQNGIANAPAAAAAAPALQLVPGMVPYNIAQVGPGAFHRGTGGRLAAASNATLREWAPAFERADVGIDLHADLLPVQWGKLLINLNNPVNALSGLPLRDELLQRGYRLCFAALMEEALAALARAGIEPARVAAVPARRLIQILRLPTPLFRLIAARMLRIDAQARSSMADDLAQGRRTEIDVLSGEVVRLAAAHGVAAPLNAKMVALLEAWPQRGRPWPARQLRSAIGL